MSPSLLICVWACVTFDLTYLPLPTQTNSHVKQLEEELRGLDQSLKSLHASDEKVYMLVAKFCVYMSDVMWPLMCLLETWDVQTIGRMLLSSWIWILNT